jgi:hypothetical protein
MSQTLHLITTLKRQLKARGVTYAQVAIHLKKSEASIKRQFSQLNFSLRTLESICDLIDLDVVELVLVTGCVKARLSGVEAGDAPQFNIDSIA